MTLKDKFEVTDNGVNVYVYFGFAAPNDTYDKSIIYGDFDIIDSENSLSPVVDFKNVVKEFNLDPSNGNTYYKIDNTNKDQFSQYKFVFKSNNGSYYFSQVEKVK